MYRWVLCYPEVYPQEKESDFSKMFDVNWQILVFLRFDYSIVFILSEVSL